MIAGFYGKLPARGDFVRSGLPRTFTDPWDDWLQPSLSAAKEAMGERWLDLYLTFPVWRFVMPDGLVGGNCWIGVFLPSVDRVGRCFPLTICEPVTRSAAEAAGLIGIDHHLGALAQAGVDALDADSVDFLEEKLAAVQPLRSAASDAATAGAVDAAAAGRAEEAAAGIGADFAAGPSSSGAPGSTPGRASGSAPGAGAVAAPQRIPLEAWLRRPGPLQDASPIAWPLNGSVPAVLALAASRFVVATLRDRVLWWSPADNAGDGGALLLAPYPFSRRLLGNLIGTGG